MQDAPFGSAPVMQPYQQQMQPQMMQMPPVQPVNITIIKTTTTTQVPAPKPVERVAAKTVYRYPAVWGIDDEYVTCEYCGFNGRTNVSRRPHIIAWISCIVLCFVFPLCFFLPFLMCKENVHKCRSCFRRLN